MIRFENFHFNYLKSKDLYNILKLRNEVFILEQNCIYQDLDDIDLNAHHVLAFIDDRFVGHSRIIKRGLKYKNYSSIGRLVLKKQFRGNGNGFNLMKYSLNTCKQMYPKDNIKISAQCYLKSFYEDLGFINKGKNYLEDGIPHCSMFYFNN